MTPRAVALIEKGVAGAEIDRRRFLKRAATVAWATPAIMTVISSPAYGQTSCPTGNNVGAICSVTTASCAAGCCCCSIASGCGLTQTCGASQILRCCYPTGFSGAGNPCVGNGTNNAPMASCCTGTCGSGNSAARQICS